MYYSTATSLESSFLLCPVTGCLREVSCFTVVWTGDHKFSKWKVRQYWSTQVCSRNKEEELTNITTKLGSRNFIYINDCYHISSLFTKVGFSYMVKTDFKLTTGCTDSLSSSSWPTTRKNVCVIECRMLQFQHVTNVTHDTWSDTRQPDIPVFNCTSCQIVMHSITVMCCIECHFLLSCVVTCVTSSVVRHAQIPTNNIHCRTNWILKSTALYLFHLL